MTTHKAPPYSPPPDYEKLLTRVSKTPSRAPKAPNRTPPKTLRQLTDEARISIGPERTTASALVLVIYNTTCINCHATEKHSSNCLVRYDQAPYMNSVIYTREAITKYLALPREIKVHENTTPFCDKCF